MQLTMTIKGFLNLVAAYAIIDPKHCLLYAICCSCYFLKAMLTCTAKMSEQMNRAAINGLIALADCKIQYAD